MAVHDDSNGQKQKSSDAVDEIPTFNVENMQNNTRIINYSRTFMSIIGGVVAGISGYDGLMGFVFYFIAMAITTAGLAAKTGFDVHSYFDSWNRIFFDGILGGLLSFVLFWTYPYSLTVFLFLDNILSLLPFLLLLLHNSKTNTFFYNIIVFLACIHLCMLKNRRKHTNCNIVKYNILALLNLYNHLAFRYSFAHTNTHVCI